jgi:hypothetical protein
MSKNIFYPLIGFGVLVAGGYTVKKIFEYICRDDYVHEYSGLYRKNTFNRITKYFYDLNNHKDFVNKLENTIYGEGPRKGLADLKLQFKNMSTIKFNKINDLISEYESRWVD